MSMRALDQCRQNLQRWRLAVGRSKREGICALRELQSLLCFLAGGFFRFFSSSESELSLYHPMGRGKVLGGGTRELNGGRHKRA